MSRRSWIITSVIGAVMCVVLIAAMRPIQIAYHRYGLDQIDARLKAESRLAQANGAGTYGDQDIFDRQQWHCDRLVALGYFFHKTYEMENLLDTKVTHRAFCQLVFDAFPNSPYVSVWYPNNVLEVWDLDERRPEWDMFAEKHDVVDFTERFANTTDVDAEQSDGPMRE